MSHEYVSFIFFGESVLVLILWYMFSRYTHTNWTRPGQGQSGGVKLDKANEGSVGPENKKRS